MFLLISCFTVILLPFCVTKLIEFYSLPHSSLGRHPAECHPALEGYTLPPLSSTEASLCHGKWTGKKESAWGTMGSGKRRREVSSLLFLIIPFFYWNSQQEPLWGREGCPSHRSQHGHHASCQGRSQEETTTEANTRSVVRNQRYEIF